MIQQNHIDTTRQTNFIPSHHLAIANKVGHQALTLYLLLKYELNQSPNGWVNLNVLKISDDLKANVEKLEEAIEALGEYGMLYDEKTRELLCMEMFWDKYSRSMRDAHQVLDLASEIKSEHIREFLIDYVHGCL